MDEEENEDLGFEMEDYEFDGDVEDLEQEDQEFQGLDQPDPEGDSAPIQEEEEDGEGNELSFDRGNFYF